MTSITTGYRTHTIIRSLDPQCTPLKHRYDSCFNLWFEGYLQPALDGRVTGESSTKVARSPSMLDQSSSSLPAPSSSPSEVTSAETPGSPSRKLITNWSHAFRSRPRLMPPAGTEANEGKVEWETSAVYEMVSTTVPSIDKRGKTRAQIKAEEYDLACGQHWRDYQGCLKVRYDPAAPMETDWLAECGCSQFQLVDLAGAGQRGTSFG